MLLYERFVMNLAEDSRCEGTFRSVRGNRLPRKRVLDKNFRLSCLHGRFSYIERTPFGEAKSLKI